MRRRYSLLPLGELAKETGRYLASAFTGSRKLKMNRSASDARTAGINDIKSLQRNYPPILLPALLRK